MKSATRLFLSASFALLSAVSVSTPAEEPPRQLREQDLKALRWRSIGPANMGGRVSDFAVVEKDPYTIYVGLGTGGVFKTTNNGTTWQAVFDKQAVASVGAVAVSQGNPKTVWVGTGESNSRNSSSWGNGIYKSTDGGETWKNMGLADTHDIARIAIDPKSDDVVYVAALGHLWGTNKDRGVFKTADGGKTWTPVLQADEKTGAIDVVVDPSNPSTVYAALWARQRSPYSFAAGGSTGGIFKSSDGGKTWKKLTEGLPAEASRIGLDIYRKNPKVLFAVIESDLGGSGSLSDVRSRAGGVFRTEDGGAHWKRVADIAPRGFYFSKVRIDPTDDSRIYVLGFGVAVSDDGGKTFWNTGAKDIHVDCHAMWIDPSNSNHVLLGTDGGIYFSYDRAKSWDFQNTVAIGEFYNVSYGMDQPYTICGGLQDNGTWCGPSATHRQNQGFGEDKKKASGITNADWIDVNGGDGFWSAIDPTDAQIIYAESQGGHISRLNLASGKRKAIQPVAKEGTPAYRFNWNTPFVISHFDSKNIYLGGNVLFRLTERGDKWEAISPDLTTRDPAKMATAGSNAENYCTIVAISESPKDKNVLWAGTDDGNIQVTRDGGKTWTNVAANVAGLPPNLWVSRLEASHFEAGRAYVSIDGHRSDIFHPQIFATEDFGKTWTSIAAGLPEGGPVKALREDPVNPNLLFAGTEFGLFVSTDRGAHWMQMKEGLPTVAVDDIQIHPREHDLIIATHGRSIYVMDDISPLEQLTAEKLESEAVLLDPRPATEFYFNDIGGLWGARVFKAKNPPFGAYINYYLKSDSGKDVKITIEDARGKKLRELESSPHAGINRAVWDLEPEPSEQLERAGGGGEGRQPRFVVPGEYTVTLSYGDSFKTKTKLRVEAVPGAHEGEFVAP
ncbi:MAG: WD40/YVTN/BNR-like repeat-containing protein [Thermoanaerobaculia bacterium]